MKTEIDRKTQRSPVSPRVNAHPSPPPSASTADRSKHKKSDKRPSHHGMPTADSGHFWERDADFYSRENINEARPSENRGEPPIEMSEFHSTAAPYSNLSGDTRLEDNYEAFEGVYEGTEPPTSKRTDQRIFDEICALLGEEPLIDATDINVEIEEGTVRLSGTVPTSEMRARAEDTIEGVLGVLDIENRLGVPL